MEPKLRVPFDVNKGFLEALSIVREGFPFIVVPAALSVAAALLGFWHVAFWYVSLVLLVLTAFMAYFFRDPQRVTPDDPNLVVAPADGRIFCWPLATP